MDKENKPKPNFKVNVMKSVKNVLYMVNVNKGNKGGG